MRILAWASAIMMVAAAGTGCFEVGSPAATPQAGTAPTKMLPAWKLPGDYKVAGKADDFDDYRAAHPDLYAITAPPSVTGLRMMTEWEPMQSVILAYSGGLGAAVNKTMAEMVKGGVKAVDWTIVVPSASLATEFTNLLKNDGVAQNLIDERVHFVVAPLDSLWAIDFGPFPILRSDNSVAFADFRYYHERMYDDGIPAVLAKQWGLTDYRAEMDFEGGNLQMDEVGTCYHSQGLFDENPGLTQQQIHDKLTAYLGCKTFVALEPLQDGTTHMDMFSKLTGKDTFILGKCDTTNCTQATVTALEHDLGILQAATLGDGTKLQHIYRIPMPYQKDDVWRTYTNSTMANKVNLIPVYSAYATLQAEAMGVWAQALPDWTHTGVESGEIITWGGAQHCISRTIPVGSFTKWVADGVCNGTTCVAPAGGYDGACTSSAACVGPQWVCSCTGRTCGDDGCGTSCGTCTGGKVCTAGACVEDLCKGVTYEGCCTGKKLSYCDTTQASPLVTQDCGSSCGWNASGYYDCDLTGADPSGTYKRACGSCTPSCAGKVCGDDGCGHLCGSCAGGLTCSGGQCVEACAGVTVEGCCDGTTRKWCQDGVLQTEGCASSNTGCGWKSPGGQAADGYYCGGAGTDPAGKFPAACPAAPADGVPSDLASGDVPVAGELAPDAACKPDCVGRACGNDGCGGTCGPCLLGETCSAQGACVPATGDGTPSADVPTGDGTVGPDTASTDGGSSGCSAGATQGGLAGTLLALVAMVGLFARRRDDAI